MANACGSRFRSSRFVPCEVAGTKTKRAGRRVVAGLLAERAPLNLVTRTPVSYQLRIEIARSVRVTVGRLGDFVFPAGRYVYTGSAKRNFESRIARHLRSEKALRWHIDWLLAARGVKIVGVGRSRKDECALNHSVRGHIVVPGFGASDCRHGCGSHLRYLGELRPRDQGPRATP
jgi:Uri superfamily endonuclease